MPPEEPRKRPRGGVWPLAFLPLLLLLLLLSFSLFRTVRLEYAGTGFLMGRGTAGGLRMAGGFPRKGFHRNYFGNTHMWTFRAGDSVYLMAISGPQFISPRPRR